MNNKAQRIMDALAIASDCAQIDGAHHKMWVIDQMVMALLRDEYNDWVLEYEANGLYEWDTGIAP